MAIIEGKKIVKVYGEGQVTQQVLNGIDVAINAGEAVAIMGKSGAGKSTLLHQLAALDVPTSGQVIVDGQDIHQLSEEDLVRFRLYTFGYIFQDYALIPDLTAIENVQVPLLMRGMDWDTAHSDAKEALRSVGLDDKDKSLPAHMSGGEQQRVSIARAIAGKPKILFADEPTANLDSKSGQSIISLLTELHKNGQTVVMVTHEESYTDWCDRIVFLEDGRIVSDRTTEVS